MNMIVTAGAGGLLHEKSGGCLQNFDCSLLVSHLLTQRLDLRQLHSGRPHDQAPVDASLVHPLAQCFGSGDPQRRRYLNDLTVPVQDLLNRSATQLRCVLRWTSHNCSLLPRSLPATE